MKGIGKQSMMLIDLGKYWESEEDATRRMKKHKDKIENKQEQDLKSSAM